MLLNPVRGSNLKTSFEMRDSGSISSSWSASSHASCTDPCLYFVRTKGFSWLVDWLSRLWRRFWKIKAQTAVIGHLTGKLASWMTLKIKVKVKEKALLSQHLVTSYKLGGLCIANRTGCDMFKLNKWPRIRKRRSKYFNKEKSTEKEDLEQLFFDKQKCEE